MATALVTGASSGIGEAFARLFAADHYNLVLVARSKEKLDSLKTELEANHGVSIFLLPLDLSVIDCVSPIQSYLTRHGIVVDLLINNAGFGAHGSFLETSQETERDMILLNILTLTELTKFFAKSMVKRGKGHILNVASTAAFFPGPYASVYYATKAYVLSFSLALSEELRGSGVTITTLCPGATQSNFADRAGMKNTKLFGKRNLPTSEEVALFGYKALMAGKRLAIHGWFNRVQITVARILPPTLLSRIVVTVQNIKKQ